MISDPDERLPGSDLLAAEVARAFGLPASSAWSDLGGSWTSNLRLDFPGRDSLVVRIHRGSTTAARLAAVQAARDVVAAAGVPTVRPLTTPDGEPFVALRSGRLIEVEPWVRWNERMNTPILLERGFAVLGRVHDALRTASMPAAAATVDHANHLHSEEAAAATRRGAERLRDWHDVILTPLADRVVRHVDAVTAAEEPLRDQQVRQLVHGDFWDNNVLFRDGELAAVIDFDFMANRPRIDDLALTLYFYLLEPGRDLPTAADRRQIRRFVDAYDAGTSLPLSPGERAALPLAIARQPAWSIGRWVNQLDEADAREHAAHVVAELPVAQAMLAELPQWQDALC
ncbi:phosphotransferase enzyme family protein [Microlunatus speluncae]|uniref:phosphotransferase enzyme family protein n=1 Tax=Microlunatus speluncae TaxID=2594267 RepID=UPI0012665494|nr:phosphotransferase [Microlunatus speluncae]